MFETLRSVWKIEDLRKKIIYTIGMLILYRLLCVVPVPGIDLASVQSGLETYSLLQFMNSITGSGLQNYTIMAMGISPYINASIIMQLLTVAIPKLEEINKSGEEGRKKIAQYTRYVTVILGFLQAVGLTAAIGAQASGGTLGLITIGFCMAAGTAVAMWIGERITENGIGNGISLLIFAGIISSLATQFAGGVYTSFVTPSYMLIGIPVLIISLVLIVSVTCVDMGERRIPVQYAKRMVGRKMYGGQSTHIPLKVNSSGVLPLIFASALMQFPPTILAMFGNNWWSENINAMGFWYQLIFALLIIGFTFFYSSITFNPDDMAKNMQQNGGSIPGIRQGKPTAIFISKISKRINLFGALFLAVLATLPTLVYGVANISLPFQASSLLIAVSVALETARQLESQMLMRHYKGFLK
ncbi:MAG: preprotein translocase subunit SecY [Clostridiales bacterium]|nr:preprotein translocase subunit SecY [Clostridiales bacterium]